MLVHLFAVVLLFPSPWWSLCQTPAPQAAPPRQARPTCDAAEYRHFDFWVGDWAVTVAGKPAGTNRIERAQQGCVLIEHWTGSGGGTGTSLNFYDRMTRRWHQTWVSSDGTVLQLAGGLEGRSMVLQSAAARMPDGTTQRQRITWTPNDDGSVRQLWEATSDDGKTWRAAFDGLYRRH